MQNFDVVVLGAGPGGYVAAIRLTQLGFSVAIVEKRKTLGGTCLNVGCIPSKALLDSSEHYQHSLEKLSEHGVLVSSVKLDLKKMQERKGRVVKEVTEGVAYLMKKNKITVFHGHGKFSSPNEVQVFDESNKLSSTISFQKAVIATGSVPVDIKGFEIDGKKIITSDHAIALEEVPKRLLIVGAGVIGLELGSVWNRLGSEVTFVELLPGLLGNSDKQTATTLQRTLEKQKMKFYFEHKVVSLEKGKKEVTVHVENKTGEKLSLQADVVMMAIGRKPYYENLGLENLGIGLNAAKRIDVNKHTFQTNLSHIYAIGDVIDGPMLAHKAEEEGIAVAEIIAGQKGHVNYKAIPSIVYTWPEVAFIGLGEEELKNRSVAYNVGKCFFKANARAKAMNEADGFVKILADATTDEILGCFIIGPRASDMIAEMAIAIEFGASSEDIARSVHAHPTLSEVIKEAALDCSKRAIHS